MSIGCWQGDHLWKQKAIELTPELSVELFVLEDNCEVSTEQSNSLSAFTELWIYASGFAEWINIFGLYFVGKSNSRKHLNMKFLSEHQNTGMFLHSMNVSLLLDFFSHF